MQSTETSLAISLSSRLTWFLSKSINFTRSSRRINFLNTVPELANMTDNHRHDGEPISGPCTLVWFWKQVFWILNFEWWKSGSTENRSVEEQHHEHSREEILVEAWWWFFLRDDEIKVQGHKEYTWADYIQNPPREKHVNRHRPTSPSLSWRPERKCKDPDKALERHKDLNEALWTKCLSVPLISKNTFYRTKAPNSLGLHYILCIWLPPPFMQALPIAKLVLLLHSVMKLKAKQ